MLRHVRLLLGGLAWFGGVMLATAAQAAPEPIDPPAAAALEPLDPPDGADTTVSRPSLEGLEPVPLNDPRLRGVALADLANPTTDAVLKALVASNPGRLDVLVSASLVSAGDDNLVVDLVGRAPRFRKKNVVDHSDRKRGLGVVRVTVPLVKVAPDAAGVATPLPAPAVVVWEHAFADMHPILDVSLSDEVAVLEDLTLGFRRVWPVGIGAADRIRRPGRLASLTPTTDGGRLSKDNALAVLGGWNRGQPYMPMNLPTYGRRPNGEMRRWFYETRVAFHAWPGQGFIRGYVSRGCVILRDEELKELFAVVQAMPDDLAFGVHAAPIADAHHPWPYADDVHWRLQDFGREGHPQFRISGLLYVIEKITAEPPPDRLALVDIYSDSEARFVVAELTGRGCGPVPVPLRMSDGGRCVAERGLIGN